MDENHNPLEQCKVASLAAENMSFPARLNFAVEYNGAAFQADPKSYLEITQALQQEMLPNNFYWVDRSNNLVPMTRENLQGLANVIFARRFELFNEHQKTKQKIRNAKTVEQIFENNG